MKLTYKITIPVFLGLILTIFLVAMLSKYFLENALVQEAFLTNYEAVLKHSPKFLKAEYFSQPFTPSAQEGFKSLSEEVRTPSMVRFTVWSKDGVILFSDLKSVIGFSSPNHQELKRLFSEEKPFFLVRKRDTNQPVQSEVGEFLDIYIPIQLSREIVGAVQIHLVLAAVLFSVEKQARYTTYILSVSAILILAVVYFLANHLRGEVDRNRELYEHTKKQAVELERAHQASKVNLERIQALREIDAAITSTLELDAVLSVLLQKIDLVLPYSATTVRLFNKRSGLLEPVACRNLDEKEWKAEKWKGGRGTPNVAFEGKAPVMVGNVQTDPRVKDPEFFRKRGLVSYLGVPLLVQDGVLGVISFYTKEEHEFTNEEVDFLSTLAGQAAIAIHNSQLYEEMTKLAANLSRSNKVKDEFLSVMSHELRTPLNVVMGYTGMIKDRLLGEINPEQEKALEKVINRAREQLTMISGILAATQMEAEGIRVQRREVRLKDFLDDLQSGYSIPLGKEVSLVWDYPSELPVIHTDDEKLRHILQNLVNNAIKFTNGGSVTVSARCVDGTGDGENARPHGEGNPRERFVELRVRDTGVGIAKEHLSLIFERFRQVDSSETRKYGGVGMGLYIVKKLTELLGGEVKVESEVGKGSTFTVTIPRSPEGEEKHEAERVS